MRRAPALRIQTFETVQERLPRETNLCDRCNGDHTIWSGGGACYPELWIMYTRADTSVCEQKRHKVSNRTPVGLHVDKDKASLTKIKNLHEASQTISYRPKHHHFELEMLRAETWDH